jgi:Lrp/AsnC family transcriptional regulator, regulator for asnA, asnC and gidA
MCGGQPQSNPILVGPGITLCLSLAPHPRDKRACLPSFITPQSLRTSEVVVEAKLTKWPKISHFLNKNFCIFKNIQIFAYYCRENSKTSIKMAVKLNLDKLDLQIIHEMMENAEISYAELGKKLFVSGGTIHVRIKKLQELAVAKGTKLHVDLKQLGYDVIAFIGIYLEKSSLYDSVARELQKIPEIVRLNYTTGNYSMFAEIVCKDINQLRFVLHDELQKIKGIERTETFISLDESFTRNVQVFKE